ncbi:MAG: DUF3857 domain-containing protein [Reichenbachiella sp.]|uniref:DUF3857 domain-containing protein n=1 Tax=Reichenbachiella sp. TaxID=2184521 RepID=UPI003263AEBB
MKLFVTITISLIVNINFAYAQAKISKWGKLTKFEIELKNISFDKEANAVILGEKADIAIFRGEVYTKYHIKIKILSRKGLDQADISIPYNPKADLESIGKINAQTLNVVNGKVEATKLLASDIYTENSSETHHEKKFTFKNVKIGSVIEYKYTKTSKSVRHLEYWYFQNDIPTLLSVCTVDIPEDLDYRPIYNGSKLKKKYLEESTDKWFLTNLPSIKKEDFVFNHLKYAEGISFQLEGYKELMDVSSNEVKSVQTMTTWKQLSQEIANSERFSSYLSKRKISEKIVSGLNIQKDTLEEVFNYVQNKFIHSNNYGIFPRRPVGKLLGEVNEPADADEINLLLVSLLRNSGIAAYPMLISMRSYGEIMKSYPLLDQFNHLIVYVNYKGVVYYLDASDSESSTTLLPVDCLSQEGYIIDQNFSEWKPIIQSAISKQKVDIKISQLPDKTWKYNYKILLEGYEAQKFINSESTIYSELFEAFETSSPLTRTEYVSKDGGPGIAISSNIILEPESSSVLYLSSDPLSLYPKNPYKNDTRAYPIELDYPFIYEKKITLIVPENLQIVSLADNVNKSLPNDCGSLQIFTKANSSILSSNVKLDMPQMIIPQFFLDRLKQLYQHMVTSSEEMLVLKGL